MKRFSHFVYSTVIEQQIATHHNLDTIFGLSSTLKTPIALASHTSQMLSASTMVVKNYDQAVSVCHIRPSEGFVTNVLK